jgi:hypothetical protein
MLADFVAWGEHFFEVLYINVHSAPVLFISSFFLYFVKLLFKTYFNFKRFYSFEILYVLLFLMLRHNGFIRPLVYEKDVKSEK